MIDGESLVYPLDYGAPGMDRDDGAPPRIRADYSLSFVIIPYYGKIVKGEGGTSATVPD